jgi:hypothetical protein
MNFKGGVWLDIKKLAWKLAEVPDADGVDPLSVATKLVGMFYCDAAGIDLDEVPSFEELEFLEDDVYYLVPVDYIEEGNENHGNVIYEVFLMEGIKTGLEALAPVQLPVSYL